MKTNRIFLSDEIRAEMHRCVINTLLLGDVCLQEIVLLDDQVR